MPIKDEKLFIKEVFQKLIERGWINKKPKRSLITNEDIQGFEEKYQIQLPTLYKEYLLTYQLPCSSQSKRSFLINGIIYNDREEGPSPLWLLLDRSKDIKALTQYMEEFRTIAVDYCQAPEGSYNHFIPIGDWGAGWGPLCIDLSLAKKIPDINDQSTWSIVWFDHEEFDWEDEYLEEDGLLYGNAAAPDFQTLLEWYFFGTLEKDFENEYKVKLDYNKLINHDFCESYWDDCWKVKED